MKITRLTKVCLSILAACLTYAPMHAQFLGPSETGPLHDLALLKPPAGADVAIVVFEDLGCPACAHAHPIELKVAAAEHVPIVRYDFPLQAHIWTFQGAVDARYIQVHISPKLADQYRSDVFAAQMSIANKDDLQNFTEHWLQRHGKEMPFIVDPNHALAQAVQRDLDLGRRINLNYTPTILVVTRDKQQVVSGTGDNSYDNPERILPVVEAALAQSRKTLPAAHHNRSTH
ncbi:MAG: thioredoxin domain-containing protein [Acidobacteriaceae bacterium]